MRSLLDFFAARSSLRPLRLAACSAVAGMASTLLLYILNVGAGNAAQARPSPWLLEIFVVGLLISIVAQRHLFVTTAADIQDVLHRYRVEQVERIGRCDLDAIEAIGPALIFGALTRQTNTISTGTSAIVMGAQSVVLVVFALVYLAWLGVSALVLVLTILGVGALLYVSRMSNARHALAVANARENDLFDAIGDMLGGFKEIQLNRRRSGDLAAFIATISQDVGDLTTEVDIRLAELFIFSQLVMFGASAALVFLLPGMGFVQSENLLKMVTVMLFLLSPIMAMTAAAQAITAAGASYDVLVDLERQLAAVERDSAAGGDPMTLYETIELRGALYRHGREDDGGFEVGPINLVLHPGEVLFISGGNGSGKSTLLKMLTGLYIPQAGELLVDGTPVDAERRQAHQSLFATVFSDFHLFEEPFGLHDLAEERVSDWLKLMEIDGKAAYRNGRFETVKLSTGQRKRLALVVAALEDRPILVLDEFAADQDPAFRRTFYERILPQLQRQGRTIVAVTHDERYFDKATRHLTMLAGRLVDQSTARLDA